jgi:hypothetical protein
VGDRNGLEDDRINKNDSGDDLNCSNEPGDYSTP